MRFLRDLQRRSEEVACTRPCVDAGWMLPTQQVGQSGISVKPKLYLAFGIAGAIQHMTGIDADCIISVNNNPRAAIFAYSDYGVVSDAKKLLESMLKQVEEGKNSYKNRKICCVFDFDTQHKVFQKMSSRLENFGWY